jgi:hypothetical protein
MRLSRILVPATLALAASGPMHAGERSSGWTSLFADFFLGPAVSEEFRWTGAVAAGGAVEVKGVNGAISAEKASGSEVEVRATKRGRRQRPSEVEIKVLEHARGITVCAVYPTPSGAAPNECQAGGGGRMNVRDNDVQVEFEVRLPAGLGFVGRTVNGAVRAKGLAGDVEAHTVNGSVEIATAGNARAETVNGSVRATLGRADWADAASFKTVNGAITLALPADLDASLEASTVNGSVRTDFTLSEARVTRRSLRGTVGKGGRRLALGTVNGSIHVQRAN